MSNADKPVIVGEYETSTDYFQLSEKNFEEFKKVHVNENSDDDELEGNRISHLKIVNLSKTNDIYRFQIKATSYVGVFSIPNNPTLIVEPKLGSIDKNSFLKMLKYVEPENIFIQEILSQGLKADSNFIEVFLNCFLKHIFDLLSHDMQHGYNSIEKPLAYLKGKINFPKTINRRFQGQSQIVCNYYTFDSNTLINQAIKYTLELIQQVIPSESVLIYQTLKNILNFVSIMNFRLEDFDRIVFTPLNHHYFDIISWCKLIVKDQMISLNEGVLKFPCFCFNAWDIFEKFIRKILNSEIKKIYPNYSLEKKKILNFGNRNIKPDILFVDSQKEGKDNFVLVADVKYKKKYYDSDFDQINTYRTELGLKVGVLIHPTKVRTDMENCKFRWFDFKEWDTNNLGYLTEFAKNVFRFLKNP